MVNNLHSVMCVFSVIVITDNLVSLEMGTTDKCSKCLGPIKSTSIEFSESFSYLVTWCAIF